METQCSGAAATLSPPTTVKADPMGRAAALSPEKELRTFLARYEPKISRFARAARGRIRGQVPGGIEFVYDNYNGLVLGYGPTERPSEAILSLVLFPRWVTLCFLKGAVMPDPKKLLMGSGNIVCHLRLEAATDLDKPDIKRFIRHAITTARPPFSGSARLRTVIRAVSKKQRPRRPA